MFWSGLPALFTERLRYIPDTLLLFNDIRLTQQRHLLPVPFVEEAGPRQGTKRSRTGKTNPDFFTYSIASGTRNSLGDDNVEVRPRYTHISGTMLPLCVPKYKHRLHINFQ